MSYCHKTVNLEFETGAAVCFWKSPVHVLDWLWHKGFPVFWSYRC